MVTFKSYYGLSTKLDESDSFLKSVVVYSKCLSILQLEDLCSKEVRCSEIRFEASFGQKNAIQKAYLVLPVCYFQDGLSCVMVLVIVQP